MDFQILDADYTVSENKPVIRLFGRGDNGKSVCCMVSDFEPYFYLRATGDLSALSGLIKDTFEQVKKVEIVSKFEPIGYQKTRKEMLRVTTHLPKDVPAIRDEILKIQGAEEVYETDILFRNRFLIDRNLGGMVWVSAEDGADFKQAPELITQFEDESGKAVLSCQKFACDKVISPSMIQRLENLSLAPLKYLSFDIECLPLNGGMPSPETSPIIMMSFSFEPAYKGHKTLILVGKPVEGADGDVSPCMDEAEMLSRFFEIFCEYDPDIVIGYNHQEFDIPYITERVKVLNAAGSKINPVVGRDGSPIGYRKFGLITRTEMKGRVVVDALPLVRRGFSLKQYTLRTVAKELLNREKLDVSPGDMEEYWADSGDKLQRFIDYSRRDSELALELILELRLLDKYVALAQVSGTLLQEIVDGGQTSMVEQLLLREFGSRDRLIPPKPGDRLSSERYDQSSDLKGGEVLEPIRGLLDNVLILDYKSLYPTIMMAHNLCYTTVVTGDRPEAETIRPPSGGEFVPAEVSRGIVPSILEDLLERRGETKKLMKLAKDENEYRVYDATQLAIKILLNSFYGYAGYARARLYSLTLANAVTSFGRSNIQNTRDLINKKIRKVILREGSAYVWDEVDKALPADRIVELSVAYGDTDSVFVHCKSKSDLSLEDISLVGNRLAEIVSASLPAPMELEFESIAKRALLIAKKRYALWLFEPKNSCWEDKIKVKGMETVRRDWCELTSKTLNRVLELVLREGEVEKAVEYVRNVVSGVRNLDLQKDPKLIDNLILTRTLTKKLESYKNRQPHLAVVEKTKERTGITPSIGTRIPFVIIAGRDLFVNRAEDPDYVREHNVPLDVDYYVKKQILPPVERILEVFGVKMSSLDFDSKQKGLFDFETKKPAEKKLSSKKERKEADPCSDSAGKTQSTLFDF